MRYQPMPDGAPSRNGKIILLRSPRAESAEVGSCGEFPFYFDMFEHACCASTLKLRGLFRPKRRAV